MVNHNGKAEIYMNRVRLKEEKSIKYFGAALSKDGISTTDVCINIAKVTAPMSRLERVWRHNIKFTTKYSLYKSLLVRILLCGCKMWTLENL